MGVRERILAVIVGQTKLVECAPQTDSRTSVVGKSQHIHSPACLTVSTISRLSCGLLWLFPGCHAARCTLREGSPPPYGIGSGL
jgi:hypothetical protein